MQNADIYNPKRLYKDAKCRHINKLPAMLNNRHLKHLTLFLILIVCASWTKHYSGLEEYFKVKGWEYPIHFEINDKVQFASYCGDTSVIRDSYLNMSRDSYMDKVYDRKKLISKTGKFNSQLKKYLSYMLEPEGFYISSPIFCLWPPIDSYITPGTIFYTVTVSQFYISNDALVPCNNCNRIESNIYKKEMMVTFEVEEDSLGFVSWYYLNK